MNVHVCDWFYRVNADGIAEIACTCNGAGMEGAGWYGPWTEDDRAAEELMSDPAYVGR